MLDRAIELPVLLMVFSEQHTNLQPPDSTTV